MQTPLTAAAFFAAKLAHQTDPSDLAADRAAGRPLVVVDVRSAAGWAAGRIPGAVHLPGHELAERARDVLPDLAADVVVYCWGPGCNGSTRAALALVGLGYGQVRELIGGYEYWVREGMAVVGDAGRSRRQPDPLTAPTGGGSAASAPGAPGPRPTGRPAATRS